MADEQPLLDKSRITGRAGDESKSNEQNSPNNSFNWRRYFGSEKNRREYEKLKNTHDSYEPGTTDKKNSVGLSKLFKFADGLDYILMLLSICLTTIQVYCIIANIVLFGQITGFFATQSFIIHCQAEHEGFIAVTTNQSNSSSAILTIPLICDRSFNLDCQNGTTLSATTTVQTSVLHLIRQKTMDTVHKLLVIGFTSFLCSSLAIFVWSITTKRQTSRMNISLFRSLITRNMTYMDAHSPSELTSKLSDNLPKIELGIGIEFLLLFCIIMCIINGFLFSFITNWALSLVLSWLLPIAVGSSMIFSRRIAYETHNELTTYSRAGRIVQEVFSSLRTVHSLNGGQFEQKRYERELDPAYWTTVRKGVVYGTYVGWFSLIYHLVYVSGFIIGSVLMTSTTGHVTTIDHILVIVMLFAECIQLLGYIGPCFQSFSEGREAAVSVFNLIEKGQDATVIEHDLLNENQFTGDTTLDFIDDIEFDHVNFMYPSRKEIMVLNNLNVIFRANRKTALVGPSGCGKSTCISLLLGYYEPSSGRINIGSRSLTEYGIKQFRQNIGVVSQEAIVFSMSIYDNIRLGKRNATRDEIEAAAREANAHKFIMKLPDKYETSIGESGVQLSGGEKQRIVLARALVKQPKVLLLDEATSALDNINEKIVQEALDRASKNRTTIVIAHRLTTIQNADYIYVFDEGRVIEEGTHKTLMTKQDGRYQSMVRTQQTIKRNEEERDDLLNTETIIAEKEKQIVFESGALSEGQFVYRNQRKDLTLSNRKSIFLRLLAMNASEWVTILVGCIACILIGLTQPMFALMLTNIINAFKNCGSTDIRYRVSVASLLFILLGVISTFIFLFQYTAFAIVGSKLVQRIRSKAFACLLRQEIAYFDEVENSSGSICARLASNATALQDMTGTRLGAVCESLSLVCCGILFGFILSWRLTIVLFVPIFILSIMMYVTIQANRLLRAKTDIYYNRANSVAVEFIHNMRTIKLLSAENEALRQYTELIQQIFKASLKSSFVNAMTVGVSWALDSFTIAILYWRTVVLVENNQIALDDIITVFAFVTFTLQISKIFGMLSTRIGASISAAYTFFDLFDRIPNIDNASRQGQEQSNFCGKIDFDKVKFAYPTRPTTIVLNKFQWNIKPGQRVALVGASGCGKSTIIQLLQRFYDVTEGQLFINGVDIQELNIQWLRSQLGLVSQEPSLFDLTIAENIAYGLENVPEEAIVNAAIKANIDQLIRQLPQGYQTKVGVKGTFMSGGEKQRIALARVFLRQPKILLLDEITSALDPHNEQIIQQAINQTQEDDPSRTLITIAHRLSTIHSYDSIHVIDQGRIVESGTHTELIQKHGIYYEMLFSTQNGFA